MPYCPKCGVELDTKINTCPLCQFPIPDIQDDSAAASGDSRFPRPENIYYDNMVKVKNQAFYTISIFLFSGVLVLLTINSIFRPSGFAIRYGIVSTISAWLYLFLLFGYIKNLYYCIMGIGVTSLFLTTSIDSFDGSLTWSLSYGFPIILLAVTILTIFTNFYDRSRHKNQFVFIPTHLCITTSFFCVGLECILTYQSSGILRLTWSVIVFIVLMSIAALLSGLYYKLPDRIKNKIKRKLHI